MADLITTPGAHDADSYATRTQANTFFEGERINNAWTIADNDEKDAAMRTAARDLDRFITAYSQTAILRQAMAWPWDGGFDDDGMFITAQTPDAGSGSTIEVAINALANVQYPDDFFNLGSLFIYATSDNAAPETELKAISDFVRDTGVLTTDAFSVAIPDGASLWLTAPAPAWLREAQYRQAYFALEDKTTNIGSQLQGGVQSSSGRAGGSLSYRPINTIDTNAIQLCGAARVLIDRHLPRSGRVDRG